MTVTKNPSSDNELANKNYVDNSLGGGNILGNNQTLEIYLKVSVGDDLYNLKKYDKQEDVDTTVNNYPNSGVYLLQQWNIKGIEKNNSVSRQKLMKSTKRNSATGNSGATSLPQLVIL